MILYTPKFSVLCEESLGYDWLYMKRIANIAFVLSLCVKGFFSNTDQFCVTNKSGRHLNPVCL